MNQEFDRIPQIDRYCSRRIDSSQHGIHQNLHKTVLKHLQTAYKKPITRHTQAAFDDIQPVLESSGIHISGKNTELCFDSGCGTAISSRLLALQNPDSLVVGIDRSAKRLAKQYNRNLPDNAFLVQADCADFWRLALNAGWALKKHTLLYPNPYPKRAHLKRRWHAHPVFPALIQLGGELELRTNWKIYADEFCVSLMIAKQPCHGVEVIKPAHSMTLFEKKYRQSGHSLFRVKSHLL